MENPSISDAGDLEIDFPHWFPVLLFATSATIPWLPWLSAKFSLRALLIATTLIAIVLGLAVYSARS